MLAGDAGLCRVVGWLRSEKPPSRGAGPPEQPQRGLRRIVVPARSPAAAQNHPKANSNPVFRRAVPPRARERPPSYQIKSSVTSSTAALPSLLPVWGVRAALALSSDPKGDRLRAGTVSQNQPVATTALRGGRVPSLASLVGTYKQ